VAAKRYIVRNFRDVTGVPCPCGTSYRAITSKDNDVANVHVTHILEARTHYHRKTTEFYYILEGRGVMELDGDAVDLEPGMAVMIPTGCRHAGRGDFKALIVGVPPFSDDDEFFD
jgi:mannose-6-phosphate isomerase-like protein (cupin superfamily)